MDFVLEWWIEFKRPATDHVSDHVTDHVSDHVTDHVSDHVTDHVSDHITDHVSDHVRAKARGRRAVLQKTEDS